MVQEFPAASRQALFRRDRMRWRQRTHADEIRQRWQAAAGAHWRSEQPWWSLAIDGLTRALADGRDAQPQASQLGRERADARIGLGQTLDDLNVLYRLLPAGSPPPGVVRAAVNAWTEVVAHRPALPPGPVDAAPEPVGAAVISRAARLSRSVLVPVGPTPAGAAAGRGVVTQSVR